MFAREKKYITIWIFAFLLMAGCAHESTTPVTDLDPPPSQPISRVDNPGSLYQPNKADYLFADNRARRVGDILTIQIAEESEGKSGADTNRDKESSLELGVQNFFGKEEIPLIPGDVGTTPYVQASASNEFESDAGTSRQTEISASIAARVVRVLPNDVLQVYGQRQIRVNGENQIISVGGLIRSRDIGPDNSIVSTQLAEAEIHYYGRGVVADQQHPGWLSRIIDNVWPF